METGQETRAISPTGRSDGANPVVVGLGANLGDPRGTFAWVLFEIQKKMRLDRVSALYRSAPIGPEQPDFLNAAVLVDFAEDLEELLLLLQGFEAEAGRVRLEHWGPRVLDLDILWAGNLKLSSSSLTVPHAELANRAFALRPLLDVRPDARQPENGPLYQGILGGLESQRLEPVEGGNWWEAVSSP